MRKLMEKLNEETVRIERIILLAGAMTDGAFSDDLDEFLDDVEKKTIKELLGKIPGYVDLDARRRERSDSISEWLFSVGKIGFLAKFSTPVMKPISENSRSFSWGYYSSKWIYAESIDEAIDKGLEWVKEERRAEDRKAKKGGAQ